MFTLSAQDAFDLIACIDQEWATPIPAASFTDEAGHLITFYSIGGRVFRLDYNPSNTITLYFEVVGEDLDFFQTYYKEVA